MKVKNLPTTTGGSASDFLIKDNAAGTATEKITIANLALLLPAPTDLSLTWTTYGTSSTVVGWVSSTKVINYIAIGKLVIINYAITGPSNSTAASFTLPFVATNTQTYAVGLTEDNDVFLPVGYGRILAGASLVEFFPSTTNFFWTAGGTKKVQGHMILQIN